MFEWEQKHDHYVVPEKESKGNDVPAINTLDLSPSVPGMVLIPFVSVNLTLLDSSLKWKQTLVLFCIWLISLNFCLQGLFMK